MFCIAAVLKIAHTDVASCGSVSSRLARTKLITDSVKKDFLMCRNRVLLTETPPQPNLLFPAGAALKFTPLSPPLPRLVSSAFCFILSSLLLLGVCAQSSTYENPSSCLLLRSASDTSIHEKRDVSRSSATRWRYAPPTHSQPRCCRSWRSNVCLCFHLFLLMS